MADISSLLRKNIRSLTPYSSARDEYKGEEAVFLDANENPYNSPFNRYPDPLQIKLKKRICGNKGCGRQRTSSWAMAATRPLICSSGRFANRVRIISWP